MLKEHHQHQSCYQSCVTFDELLKKKKSFEKEKYFDINKIHIFNAP